MEKIKAQLDTNKTQLNHLLVLIVTIGASLGKMLLIKNTGTLFFMGSLAFVSCIIAYIVISYRIRKTIKEIK